MTLLLALAIATAEIKHGCGVYGVFPDDVKGQFIAWAVSLPLPPFPFERQPQPQKPRPLYY